MKKRKTITISRQLKVNNKLKNYLEDNMWYRRKIYNKFVEMFKEWDETRETGMLFDWNKASRDMYQYELSEFDYNYYCTGIREKCAKDLFNSVKRVIKERTKGNKSELRFTSFDRYTGSFKVNNNKAINKPKPYPTSARCMILDNNHIQFRFNKNNTQSLELKEPLKYEVDESDPRIMFKSFTSQRYRFRNVDIKEVAFVKKLNKYYINLVVEVEILDYDKPRNFLAGIDLGIHNPIMVSHANENNKIVSYDIPIPQNMLKRMNQLEKRIKRLQQIMDRKMEINRKRVKNNEISSIYTRNYEKVRKKFRRAHTKLSNLKRDWRIKSAHFLVNHYDNLVVDEFSSPVKNNETNKVSKLNKFNTTLGMFYFMENLKWMASKYNCCHIDSPSDTTRTCSVCGHVNEHLKLGKRYLKCVKCGTKIDRDENASRNCYKYGKEFLLEEA